MAEIVAILVRFVQIDFGLDGTPIYINPNQIVSIEPGNAKDWMFRENPPADVTCMTLVTRGTVNVAMTVDEVFLRLGGSSNV